MTRRPDGDLAALLSALFDSAELRRWVHQHIGPDAYDELPNPGALTEIAFKAARLAERRGLVDDRLWDALIAERPNQAERIRAVARAASGSARTTAVNAAAGERPRPARLAWLMAALAVLAGAGVGAVLAPSFGDQAQPATVETAPSGEVHETSRSGDGHGRSEDETATSAAPAATPEALPAAPVSMETQTAATQMPENATPAAAQTEARRRPSARGKAQASRMRDAPAPRRQVEAEPSAAPSAAPAGDSADAAGAQTDAPAAANAPASQDPSTPAPQRASTAIDLTGAKVGKRAKVKTGDVHGTGTSAINAKDAKIDDDVVLETGDVSNQ